MTPNMAFTLDVSFVTLGLIYIVCIVYGRIKKRPFVLEVLEDGPPNKANHGIAIPTQNKL